MMKTMKTKLECPVCHATGRKMISAPRGWGDSGPVSADECVECAAADGWPWAVDGVVHAPGCEPVSYTDWQPCDGEVARLAATL